MECIRIESRVFHAENRLKYSVQIPYATATYVIRYRCRVYAVRSKPLCCMLCINGYPVKKSRIKIFSTYRRLTKANFTRYWPHATVRNDLANCCFTCYHWYVWNKNSDTTCRFSVFITCCKYSVTYSTVIIVIKPQTSSNKRLFSWTQYSSIISNVYVYRFSAAPPEEYARTSTHARGKCLSTDS